MTYPSFVLTRESNKTVTLEELLGHTTSIAVATRESGEVVGNSLKTLYSRITTMQPAIDTLHSLGVRTHEMVDGIEQIRSVSDILGDLAGKWDSLSAAEQQNAGVKLAGRFQLSRFLVLMQNWQMGMEATEAALNSQGSAMRENDEYMKSLEARINRLQTAWETFSLSLGDAFLTNTFISIVDGLTSVTTNISKAIDLFGVLPPLLATIGTSAVLFSTKFRTNLMAVTMATNQSQAAIIALDTRLKILGRSFGLSAAGARMFSMALRSLMLATGVGAALVGVGLALEFFINKSAENRELQKEVQKQLDQSTNSYKNQKEEINELIKDYEKLTGTLNRSKLQEEEYVSLQNRLAELMPNLVAHIDDKGNAHLKNAEAIQEELKFTEKLIQNQKDQQVLDAGSSFGSVQREIRREREALRVARRHLDEARYRGHSQSEINKQEARVLMQEAKIANLSRQLRNEVSSVTNTILELAGVEVSDKLIRELESVTSNLDLNRSKEELVGVSQSLADYIELLQKPTKDKSSKELERQGKLFNYLSEELGVTSEKTESFVLALENVSNEVEQGIPVYDELGLVIGRIGGKSKDTEESFVDFREETDELGETVFVATARVDDLSNSLEGLITKYKESLSEVKTLDELHEELNETNSLSLDSIQKLAEMYDDFIDVTNLNIDKIKEFIEVKNNERIATIENERLKTQSTIDATKIRIQAMENELSVVRELRDERLNQFSNFVLGSKGAFMGGISNPMQHMEFERDWLGLNQVSDDVDHFVYKFVNDILPKLEPFRQEEMRARFGDVIGGYVHSTSNRLINAIDDAKGNLDELELQTSLFDITLAEIENRRKQNNKESSVAEEDLRQQEYRERMNRFTKIARLNDWSIEQEIDGYKRLYKEFEDYLDRDWDARVDHKQSISNLEKQLADEQERRHEEELKRLEELRNTRRSSYDQWADDVKSTANEALRHIEDYYKERARKEIQSLDDSLRAYNDYIDEQLKIMDRSDEADDYQKDLQEKLKDQADIEQQIFVLSRDNSLEAQAKRRELEEQLAKQVEDIQKFQLDRERKLRRDNYQDLRDMEEDRTNKAKQDAEERWKELLSTDRNYLSIRENLLNENIDSLQSSLQMFSQNITNYMVEMGDSIEANTIDKLLEAQQRLEAIRNLQSNINNISNRNFTNEDAVKSQMYANSQQWQTANKSEQDRLHQANWELGKSIGATYNEAEGRWYKGGLPLYHEGGQIGTKSRIGTLLDNLLNKNEVPFIGKKGELVIKDPNQAMKNIMSTFAKPQIPKINKSDSDGGKVNQFIFQIDKVVGTKEGAKSFASEAVRLLQRRGFNN